MNSVPKWAQMYPNAPVTASASHKNQLLPFAMKVAAQTIALDLVPVNTLTKPTIDLMYLDLDYHGSNRARIRKLDKLLRSKTKRWVVCKRRTTP